MPKEITAEYVWSCIQPRPQECHKGNFGRLLLVAGSRRYRGAAALCTEGALRGGAGLVTLATVEQVVAGVLPRLPEAMFLACQEADHGGIHRESAAELSGFAEGCDALCIGPGMGNTADTLFLVQTLLTAAKCPCLVDADGLNALAGQELPRPAGGLVVTPHPGEMARLSGIPFADVQSNRESVASTFARANGCVVVLKGHRTLVAAPDGSVMVNTTGNAGLSRGGSGDVLAGLIAALLAQKLPAEQAAACGVWLHGAAADLCAARLGQTTMLPHDIFNDLGALCAQAGR